MTDVQLKKLRLDRKGMAKIAKSTGVAALVRDAAESVAARVRADVEDEIDGDVVVDEYTTDRAAAAVTIRSWNGRLLQARDGVLTRAAAAEGLEVTETTS